MSFKFACAGVLVLGIGCMATALKNMLENQVSAASSSQIQTTLTVKE